MRDVPARRGKAWDFVLVVYQNVPHADNGGPGNFGVALLELRLHSLDGLAQDLEVVEDPYLNQFTALELVPATLRVFFNGARWIPRYRERAHGCLSQRDRFP